MSAEDVQQGISVFLQLGALLWHNFDPIYLFISLKNYFKSAKEDKVKMEKDAEKILNG